MTTDMKVSQAYPLGFGVALQHVVSKNLQEIQMRQAELRSLAEEVPFDSGELLHTLETCGDACLEDCFKLLAFDDDV